MGSFNASCAVSHCSINPGDPVKLIAIVSNNPTHDMYEMKMHLGFACYSYDNFSIIGYPMDATYEDYGNFEVSDDMFSRYNLHHIRKNYTMNIPPAGETISTYNRECYNIEADDLDWNTITSMIHSGSLFLDSNTSRTKRRYVGLFPIHKCVYDILMKRTPEMYFDDSYNNVPFNLFLEKQIKENDLKSKEEEYNDLVSKYMDQFSQLIGTTTKSGEIITPELILEKSESMADLDLEMASMRAGGSRVEFSYNNTSTITSFQSYIKNEKQPDLTDEQFLNLVTLDAELTFMVRGLSDLNIQIIPPMTAGQQYNKTDHATFLIAAGQALLEMEYDRNAEYSDSDEYGYNVKVTTSVDVSLQTLLDNAKDDYKPERGLEIKKLIEKFVVQYPNGVTLTRDELNELGYGLMVHDFESTQFPLVFNNNIGE